MSTISPEEAIQYALHGGRALDVRAPIEFEAGALPTACNAPILTNSEREAVGKTYKKEGQQAAIELGHRLVGGAEKTRRVAEWSRIIQQNEIRVIYCYRGGMRSSIAQAWLSDSGFHLQQVVGGYKALRKILLEVLELSPSPSKFFVLSGPTGSGKTQLLRETQAVLPVLDFEARAGHRGSSFGSLPIQQPSQANFENILALDLMKSERRGRVFVEDESRSIGRVVIPKNLFRAIDQSSRIVLDVPISERVQNIQKEYIEDALEELCLSLSWEGAVTLLKDRYLSSLARIARSLGDERFREVRNLMEAAFLRHANGHGSDEHESWILALLLHYYDPYYQKHLDQRQSTILHRFNQDEFAEWTASLVQAG